MRNQIESTDELSLSDVLWLTFEPFCTSYSTLLWCQSVRTLHMIEKGSNKKFPVCFCTAKICIESIMVYRCTVAASSFTAYLLLSRPVPLLSKAFTSSRQASSHRWWMVPSFPILGRMTAGSRAIKRRIHLFFRYKQKGGKGQHDNEVEWVGWHDAASCGAAFAPVLCKSWQAPSGHWMLMGEDEGSLSARLNSDVSFHNCFVSSCQ